jgi:hypothetical protein
MIGVLQKIWEIFFWRLAWLSEPKARDPTNEGIAPGKKY